jgi:hypothetical protein
MSSNLNFRRIRVCYATGAMAIGFALALVSMPASAEIIWSGDFNNRDFSKYHAAENPNEQYFFLVPEYGRPPKYHSGQQHVGNGELLDLVSSPTRGGRYAARLTIKNSRNGSEPRDCDPALDCGTRRVGLQMTRTMREYYNGIPYKSERWISISVFLPSDFDVSGNDWNAVIWGSKGSLMRTAGWLGINIGDNGWSIPHRFNSEDAHRRGDNPDDTWWTTVDYSANFPSRSDWPQGLADFPNEQASKSALANLNRGGWTDFVFHFRTDVGDSIYSDFERQNTGFLDLYMRAGSGPWVNVLALRPMANVDRGFNPDRIYNRGIGQYGPEGYSMSVELYGPKTRFWNKPRNTTIYIDNYKLGDQFTTFDKMSHDGSSPGRLAPPPESQPNPPVLN